MATGFINLNLCLDDGTPIDFLLPQIFSVNSGPPYPADPASDGLAEVSPFSIWDTVISQFANSPTLAELVENSATYFDQTDNLNNFYRYIWDIQTAQGVGLDIWGRIVDVSRYIDVPPDTPNPMEYPFTAGPYAMDDDEYRLVIMVKALANISNSTSGQLTKLLQMLFAGRGRCYVLDLGGMAMRFVFEFYLHPFEYVIISTLDVSPHPAGVLVDILQVDPVQTFGFMEGVQFQPFDQGTFFNPG